MADDTPQPPSLRIDWSTEPTPAYSNGVHAVHTQREFSLFFCDFVDLQGRGATEGGGDPNAKVVSSVRMTPDVFFQLAATVASNWNLYVQSFEDQDTTPRFKLVGAAGFQLEGLEATPQKPPA